MTTYLDIDLGRPYDYDEVTPVPVEIMDGDHRVISEPLIRTSEAVEVPGGGLYIVRVRLPSGSYVTKQKVVAEDTHTPVSFDLYDSPHEYLSWQRFLGEIPDSALRVEDVSQSESLSLGATGDEGEDTLRGGHLSLFDDIEADADAEAEAEAAPLPGSSSRLEALWYRVWRQSELGGWDVMGSLDEKPILDLPHSIGKVGFQVEPGEVFAFELGGDEMQTRFVLFSGSPAGVNQLGANAEALVRRSQLPSRRNGGFAAKVVTVDTMPETFSHFLFRGNFSAALSMVSSLREYATAALAKSPPEPLAALFLAYYYSITGDYGGLGDRASILAERFPTLADGAVLYGAQLLHQQNDADQAFRWFETAARRGLPLYTQGVRLLLDNLAALADDDHAGAKTLEQQVRRVTAGLDWQQRNTTYYGDRPPVPIAPPQDEVVRGLGFLPRVDFR